MWDARLNSLKMINKQGGASWGTNNNISSHGGFFRDVTQSLLDKFTQIFRLQLKESTIHQGPFCGAAHCPYFGLCMTLPMSFKAGIVLSSAHLFVCVQ